MSSVEDLEALTSANMCNMCMRICVCLFQCIYSIATYGVEKLSLRDGLFLGEGGREGGLPATSRRASDVRWQKRRVDGEHLVECLD